MRLSGTRTPWLYRGLYRKSRVTEALAGAMGRVWPAELIKPAVPIGKTAIALGPGVVQQRQLEQRLNGRDGGALGDQLRRAHRAARCLLSSLAAGRHR